MDFEDELNELFGNDEDEGPDPRWRATIRGPKLKLTGWVPWLASTGPSRKLFKGRARAGIAIADLTVTGAGEDEIVVSFLSPGRDRDQAERTIVDWAKRTGYRRVWLSERVVDLDGGVPVASAEVKCPTCGERWSDDSPEFWLTVQRSGAFPPWCFLCGSELPQWKVSPDAIGDRPPAERAAGSGRWEKEADSGEAKR